MRRNSFFQYGLLILLTTSKSLLSAKLHELNDLKTIEVHISQEGLTRIAVKGDRITNVFGGGDEYTLEADEKEGQIFLKPNMSLVATPKPIHLSFITEEGLTQDIRLIPKKMQPEAIIFIAKDGSSQGDITSQERDVYLGKKFPAITREDVESLINACREGVIPPGYVLAPMDVKESSRPYPIIKRLQGARIQVVIYEITNKASKDIFLHEANFGGDPKVIAVSLQHKILKPGEKGEVYVVRSF